MQVRHLVITPIPPSDEDTSLMQALTLTPTLSISLSLRLRLRLHLRLILSLSRSLSLNPTLTPTLPLTQALRTCRDFSSHVVIRHLGRGSAGRVTNPSPTPTPHPTPTPTPILPAERGE